MPAHNIIYWMVIRRYIYTSIHSNNNVRMKPEVQNDFSNYRQKELFSRIMIIVTQTVPNVNVLADRPSVSPSRGLFANIYTLFPTTNCSTITGISSLKIFIKLM